ncbi:MAG: hypothetical protein K2H35_03815 [Muribaculaceae bacterium]|nr:hypothetical protein [Muribaculaceae bacterium]
MNNRFDSRAFLETILADYLSADAFRSRLATLTDYQQMQVLLRLLSLWRLDEKEQRRATQKKTVSSADADETVDYFDIDDDDCDDDFPVSDNMRRVLDLIENHK